MKLKINYYRFDEIHLLNKPFTAIHLTYYLEKFLWTYRWSLERSENRGWGLCNLAKEKFNLDLQTSGIYAKFTDGDNLYSIQLRRISNSELSQYN